MVYLDDVRTPVNGNDWIIVRSYDEFINKVNEVGLKNIEFISLDHDLGELAIREYFDNVSPNYTLDYNNIHEKTGFDCAKWLVNYFYEKNPDWDLLSKIQRKTIDIQFPTVYTHSANPIGSANIMGYINNFLKNEGKPQTCVRVKVEHTIN